jgi:flagellar hook-length control protein FliK
MIPADVVTRLKLPTELLTQPSAVARAQQLPDALGEFSPGQRLMATLQALLPNGTYRAQVAQRELTLALPFAAKPGDTLELEVVEQNGKAALAVVAERSAGAAAEGEANASVSARLTATGRLISALLGGLDKEGGKRPQPAPLNNAQPVVGRFPAQVADLASALKTALVRSGMFYEAHQAQWVAGKTSLETLLAEPQGRLSPAAHALEQSGQIGRQTAAATNGAASGAGNVAAAATESGALRVGMGQVVARELTPLVQQQLEALATHSYAWQGQIWPGQKMDWEIVEEDGGREQGENIAPNWTTRLRLTLPRLGGIDATLRLVGGQEIEIRLRAENAETRALLNAANGPLQRQFASAGLKLAAFAVSRPRAEHRHAQPEPS